MKQGILAGLAGINQSYMSQIETGGADNPTVRLVESIAEVIGVTPAYLLGYSDNPLPENSSALPLSESHVVYEVESVADRQRVQRLVDAFTALTARDQEIILIMVNAMRNTGPRILGNE